MKSTGLHVDSCETDMRIHCDTRSTKSSCHESVWKKISPTRRVVYDYSEKVAGWIMTYVTSQNSHNSFTQVTHGKRDIPL